MFSVMDRFCLFFFFHATTTTSIYTLSLHDALPTYYYRASQSEILDHFRSVRVAVGLPMLAYDVPSAVDRKSTRLNSSHPSISYAVFCSKKKIIEQSRIAPPPISGPRPVNCGRYHSL